MIIVPRNWADFQHYKDRSPPWIKLHRKLLDSYDFQKLPVASRALAPMLWLLASDHEQGEINAALDVLSFRLRTTEREVMEALQPLIDAGFFEVVQSASGVLAGGERPAALEKRQRREEREERARDFEKIRTAYPKKDAMKDAEAEWAKVTAPVEDLLKAIEAQRRSEDWTKSNGKFVPLLANWLRGRRWEDAGFEAPGAAPPPADSQPAIEAEGVRLGLGIWTQTEQWPSYLAKVRKAQAAERGASGGLH
ncbi:hypothetical protein [Variovorax sp. DAIF25]|uniref:hypothetical protein n=1 Tax=Variovorax sp. DAIF25 TaxID=3080983 RepID=UPI003D6A6B5D